MLPHYEDGGLQLFYGDSRIVLAADENGYDFTLGYGTERAFPDACFDSVVCDPPYELGFMGKGWDSTGIAYDVDLWREVLRVLKPGGHLLAFGASRTWHRLASAIEDAGFEIRDSIAWLYGSGFPKSLDVSKAIASGSGRPEDIRRMQMGDAYVPSGRGRTNYDHGSASAMNGTVDVDVEFPDDAKRWEGWGTALKPAFEPIVVGRKPLGGWIERKCEECAGSGVWVRDDDGVLDEERCGVCGGRGIERVQVSSTVAANVLAHGTGALHIDATRIAYAADDPTLTWGEKYGGGKQRSDGENYQTGMFGDGVGQVTGTVNTNGRWPTNVVLDDSQAAALDEQTGVLKSGKLEAHHARKPKEAGILGAFGSADGERGYGDSGGASRFFPTFHYEAKAPGSERPNVDGVEHATVKPLDLMRWCVRLVTRRGGRVLDLFAGSGTTGEAALLEGMECTLIEYEAEHLPLILQRVRKPLTPSLFGDVEGIA